MKILFTFERQDLQIRAIDWYNFLSSLGHEVYLWNPSEDSKETFNIYDTKINYTEELNSENYDYWFYDVTPKTWHDVPVVLQKLNRFEGKLFCINYEDGYSFFEWLLSPIVVYNTPLFIGNALFKNRKRYTQFIDIEKKVFLTTSYISNSQLFRDVPLTPLEKRYKRIYFSGALTGFPSILSDYSDAEYNLRYTLAKKVIDSQLEHLIRFTSYDPQLKPLFDSIPQNLKVSHVHPTVYIAELVNSFVTFAIKGNSFPTNRFYEAQAAGCLTFTNPLHAEAEFYGTGEAGKNYVEINIDGSDIVERFNYYLTHVDEAKQIAANGRANWEKYSCLDDNGVWPQDVVDYHVNGIKEMTGIDLRAI